MGGWVGWTYRMALVVTSGVSAFSSIRLLSGWSSRLIRWPYTASSRGSSASWFLVGECDWVEEENEV